MEFSNGHEDINKEQVSEQPQVEEQEVEQEVRKGFDINKHLRNFDEVFFTYNGDDYSVIPLTAEEESEFSEFYKKKDGTVLKDLSFLVTLVKLNIVPYTVNDIKQVLGQYKEWNDLTYKERFEFLKYFESSYLIGLFNAYYNTKEKKQDDEVKK